MECNHYLLPLTVAAVAPYFAEAAVGWIKRSGTHAFRARAPHWVSQLRIKSRTTNPR
ncbi:MAG: hypothetical protein QM739_00885 [Propionivibrio sp.]